MTLPQNSSDNNIHTQQFETLSKGQRQIYIENLRQLAETSLAEKKMILEGFLRFARLIGGEKIKEVEDKYQGVSLTQPDVFNDILMSAISAGNLLLLSAASAKINVEEALRKMHEEVISKDGQLKQSNQRNHQLERENAYLRDEITRRDSQKWRDKDKTKSAEERKTETRAAPRVIEPPVPKAEEISTQDANAEGSETSQEETGAASSKGARGKKSMAEIKMTGAGYEWAEIYERWSEDLKTVYVPLIKIVGSGSVALNKIQRLSLPENTRTTADRLLTLATIYSILTKREFLLRAKSQTGHPPLAYELTTPLGKVAYHALTGLRDEEPIDKKFLRLHISKDQGELVYSSMEHFERLGWLASPVEESLQFDDGTWWRPDFKVAEDEEGFFFVEAEAGDHIKSKDLGPKWLHSLGINKNRIFLLMREHGDADNRGYGIIRNWAFSVDYREEIEVFTTGLDYLESLSASQNGTRVSPWSKRRTIRASPQKELML